MFSNIVCLFAATVCVLGAPSTDVVPLERRRPTVIPILEQSQEIEANGTFKFSYETGNGIKREEISYDKVLPKTRSEVSSDDDDEDDNNEIHVQQGSYSYPAPDGTIITVRYIADENGFRAIGDHLPKPASILVAASPSRISGRRSKTVDSDAGSSTLTSFPIVVQEVQSKNSDTSAASAPVLLSTVSTEAQESTTSKASVSTEITLTVETSASTTESASTTTEQVSTSEVTSTEQPTTSVASPEPTTAEVAASTTSAPQSSSSSVAASVDATTVSA